MSDNKLREELWVPDEKDVIAWKEYLERKESPEARAIRISNLRKERRRRKKYPDRPYRTPPRDRGYRPIIVYRDTYEMLVEMRKFYKVGFGKILRGIVKAAFDKTYRQAELLAKIEARKERANEVRDRP